MINVNKDVDIFEEGKKNDSARNHGKQILEQGNVFESKATSSIRNRELA